MGLDILDLVFRLERTFGIKIRREDFDQMCGTDVRVGELFEFVRSKAVLGGVLDAELDAETLWFLFQRAVSDSMGVEPGEVTKDRWLIRELGAG